MARHPHLQLRRIKGRGHINATGCLWQPQQILVELRRAERARKQHHGLRCSIAGRQVRCRHHIANAQGGQRLSAPCCAGHGSLPAGMAAHVKQRVGAKLLGQRQPLQRCQIKIEHCIARQQRAVALGIGNRAHHALQGAQQASRHALVHLVILLLRLVDGSPLALQAIERLFDRTGRRCTRGHQRPLRQLGRVHAAGAFEQVVRLVYQHAHLPLIDLRQRIQHGRAVEKVVGIAHHHVAPPR
ncbi:hypothetical protein D3C72_1614510 [compost metagenome]